MTHYFYDSEFIDDGKTIDLISVGIVSSDGRELYLQSTEFNIDRASPWVRENVILHLDPCPHILTNPPYSLGTLYGAQAQHMRGQCTFEKPAMGITGLSGLTFTGAYLIGTHADCPWRTREQLRRDILAFMDVEMYGKPELIVWCGSYDHIAFCQIFGTMMELPKGFPHHVQDIQVALDKKGITDDMLPKQEGDAHNALQDAKYIKKLWETVCQ